MEDKIAIILIKLSNLKKDVAKMEEELNEIYLLWESDEVLNHIKNTIISKEDYD